MRDRTPKMLDFPDLGSQVEAALKRPRGSRKSVEQVNVSGNGKNVNIFLSGGLLKRNRGAKSGNSSSDSRKRIGSRRMRRLAMKAPFLIGRILVWQVLSL